MGAWVDAMTTRHVETPPVNPNDYGYQWWIENDYYMAVGSGGQFIFVAPEKNIVAVFTSAAPMLEKFLEVKKLFKSYILAGAASIAPLQPNPDNLKRMQELLATVRPPPVKNPVPPMPKMSETVSGRTYVFDSNMLGLQSLTLTFPPNSEEALMELVFWGKARPLTVGLDNVPRITKVDERLYAYKGAWKNDNVFVYSYRYIDDNNFGDAHLEFKGEELVFTAYHKTNNFTYRANGRLSGNVSKNGWWAGKTAIVLNIVNKVVPAKQPDKVNKSDILGFWTGTDTYGAQLIISFKEDDSFKVVREPSSLGRPSIGKYVISDTKITGEADTKVSFTVKKFGDEIKGKWTYKPNGAGARFTLKKEILSFQNNTKKASN